MQNRRPALSLLAKPLDRPPQKIRTRRDPPKIGLAFELSLSANAWFVPGRDPRCTRAKSRLLCIFASETAVTSPSPVCYQTRPHRLCLKRFPTVYYQTHPAALRSVWEKERKNAGTLFRPPIRRVLGTAAAPGLPASICLQDPYSLRVVWEKYVFRMKNE